MPTLAELDAAVTKAQNDLKELDDRINIAYSNMTIRYNAFTTSECKYPFQPSLQQQISGYGALNPNSCGTKYGCDKGRCQGYAEAFNTEYRTWDAIRVQRPILESTLAAAEANRQNYIDTDPVIAQEAKDKDAARKNRNIIIIVVAIVIVIIAGIFIYRRWFRKK